MHFFFRRERCGAKPDTCRSDSVPWTFLAMIRCSLTFFAVFRCSVSPSVSMNFGSSDFSEKIRLQAVALLLENP